MQDLNELVQVAARACIDRYSKQEPVEPAVLEAIAELATALEGTHDAPAPVVGFSMPEEADDGDEE